MDMESLELPEHAATSESSVITESRQVLIVDDDPLALKLLERFLIGDGYTVLVAKDGQEAFQRILEHSPALVVTDWDMPGMSGVDLCRAIREHEGVGFVYLIILTGHSDEDRLVEAFAAGADDYVAKPFKRRELLARLRAGERIVKLEQDVARRTREIVRYTAQMEVANQKLAQVNEKLERMATTDELTGLTNRRAALARLGELWATSARHDEPLACLMIDIDHFKNINDMHGHAAGDLVLKNAALLLRNHARQGDVVCRVGGEEFLVICPRSTAEMAMVAAERLRRTVEVTLIAAGPRHLRITISGGIAQRTHDMAEPGALLKAADALLYQAKREGRNRVCAERHDNARAAPSAAVQVAVPAPQGEGRSILLVDASTSERSRKREVLTRTGYVVHEQPDGAGAIHAVRLHRPHAIVLDVFSDDDAQRCVANLRADTIARDIPILMIGSRLDSSAVVNALRAGADEYMARECVEEELLLRVQALLRAHGSRLELGRQRDERGEQLRMLALLPELTRTLIACTDLETVLERVLSVTAELACARRVAFLFPSADGDALAVARATGAPMEFLADALFPIGQGVIGRVFSARIAIVGEQSDDSERTPAEQRLLPQGAWACLPLATAEFAVGALTIGDRHVQRSFDPQELEFLELVANIAASAVQDILLRRSRDEARDSIVIALAKLAESRDDDTGRHLDRVSRYCEMLADQLRESGEFGDEINDEFIHDLRRAVPLHDIGKVAIPDSILLKPGRLTPEEMTIMRTHAEIGAETIRSVIRRAPGLSFLEMAEKIAHAHHEWHNGKGYPRGLRGDEIPLCARVATVADVYDALTSDRVYRKAMSHLEAMNMIVERSATQFDPAVVRAFLRCEQEFARLAQAMADDGRRDWTDDRDGVLQSISRPAGLLSRSQITGDSPADQIVTCAAES